MKKLMLAVWGIVLAISCAACGSDSSSDYHADGGSEIIGNISEEMEIANYPDLMVEGIYTFYNESMGGYLSFEENKVIISDVPSNWILKQYVGTAFYVYANETELLLDIDNAVVADGTTIKLWQDTGYDVQKWYLEGNKNGTYSFLSVANMDYCLGMNNGGAVLQGRDAENAMQEWTAVMVGETEKDYCRSVSDGGIIELQLPLDIHDTISEDRLVEWANNLETAYHTYYELTGFIPYEKIIVEAYKPSEYEGFFAYVTDNCNVIRFNVEYVYPDLANMAARQNDWNFAMLHEMGHMFDWDRPWNFEAEVMTDLKAAYVMEKNNAGAAPFEFTASTIFYGSDIINAYDHLGSGFSGTYDVYSCAHRFLEIKEEIGWEPFKQTFHEMQENYETYHTASNEERLNNFVQLLSKYSGRDIKSYFSTGEWNAILNRINQ